MSFPNLCHLDMFLFFNLSYVVALAYLVFNTIGFGYLGRAPNVQNMIACDLSQT